MDFQRDFESKKMSDVQKNRTAMLEQKNNRELAEAKVAQGIQKIYEQRIGSTNIKSNLQGIASLELSGEEIRQQKWDEYFPDGMANGVTIHVYRDTESKAMLPVQALIQGKIKSLCKGAEHLIAQQGIEQAIIKKLEAELKKGMEKFKDEIEVKNLMDRYISLTLSALYAVKKPALEKTPFKNFCSMVVDHSMHYRTTDTDILTFDLETGKFSYDHVVKGTTTAHDRAVGNRVANLGISFDGMMAGDHFKVTSSIVHHASLAPFKTKGKSQLEMLIDTCNHIEEVALTLARLQMMGVNKPESVDINWCYQLLTTNVFNLDDQNNSYLLIAKATGLMNDANLMRDDTQIHLSMSLLNYGINELAANKPLNKFWSQSERRRQNRKAYFHLSNALNRLQAPDSLKDENGSIRDLKNIVAPDIIVPEGYETVLQKIKDNTDQFNKKRLITNAISDKDDLRSLKKKLAGNAASLRDILESNKKIEALQIKHNVNSPDELEDKLNALIGMNVNRHELEQDLHHCIDTSVTLNNQLNVYTSIMHKQIVDERKHHINQLPALFENISKEKYTPDELLYVSCLMFKAYMDEIYYNSEKFPDRKTAILFNAYVSVYQHLVGMMATSGCKSGNDRTYIARLVLAAIQGRNLNEVSLPPDYLGNEKEYDRLKTDLAAIAMSNSCLFTGMNDTSSLPKADAGKVLGIEQGPIHSLPKFSDYATHMTGVSSIQSAPQNEVWEIVREADKKPVKPEVDYSEEKIYASKEIKSEVNEKSVKTFSRKSKQTQPQQIIYDEKRQIREAQLSRILCRVINSKDTEMTEALHREYKLLEDHQYSGLKEKFASLAEDEGETRETLRNQMSKIEETADTTMLDEAINKIGGYDNFIQLSTLFSEWLSLQPVQDDILNMGRAVYSLIDPQTKEWIGLKDITALAKTINHQNINDQQAFNQALDQFYFEQEYDTQSKDMPVWRQDKKSQLISMALNDEVSRNWHWLREEEIDKVISLLGKENRIYRSDLESLNDTLDRARKEAVTDKKNQFPIYIILNTHGRHWTIMKIARPGMAVTVEYVDSSAKTCPDYVKQALKDFYETEVKEVKPTINWIEQYWGYECGYFSLLHLCLWLASKLLTFDTSQSYDKSMNILRDSTQRIILKNTWCDYSETIGHEDAFEEVDGLYRLTEAFLDNLFTASSTIKQKPVAKFDTSLRRKKRLTRDTLEGKEKIYIQPEEDDVGSIKEPEFAPVRELTKEAHSQLEQEMAYLDKFIKVLESKDELDIAIGKRELADGVKSVKDLDERLNVHGNLHENEVGKLAIEAKRTDVITLTEKWKILNETSSWQSNVRDRMILETLLSESLFGIEKSDLENADKNVIGFQGRSYTQEDSKKHNELIQKEENETISLPEEGDLAVLDAKKDTLDKLEVQIKELLDAYRGVAHAVNQNLAPYISEYGLFEPAGLGEIKPQDGFNTLLQNLRDKYRQQLSLFNLYFRDPILQPESFYRYEEFETGEDAIRLNLIASKKEFHLANYMLVCKKDSWFDAPSWIFYHLNDKDELIARKVAGDPALEKIHKKTSGRSFDSVNRNKIEIERLATEFFYQQAHIQQFGVAHPEQFIQKIHSSQWDYNQDVKKEAKAICDKIEERIESGERMGLLYHANKDEAEKLYNSYTHFKPSLPKIFTGKMHQAVLFKEIADFIERKNYRDKVHILPIPDSDDSKQLSLAMKNLALHHAADFKVLGMTDEANRFSRHKGINHALFELQNKPVSRWSEELREVHANPESLSLFDNSKLVNDMVMQFSSFTPHPDNLVLNEIKKALSRFEDVEDVNNNNKELLWKNLVGICKQHELSGASGKNKKLDLLVRSIAQFDANLSQWSDIENLVELMMAQQKREIINYDLRDWYERLLDKQPEVGHSPAIQMKLDADLVLLDQMLTSDKRVSSSEIFASGSKYMMAKVELNDPYPIENVTVEEALKMRRYWRQATSEVKLNELRDELTEMEPATILHSQAYSTPKHLNKKKIVATEHPLLDALLEMQQTYTNLSRTTHAKHLTDLVDAVKSDIDRSKKDDPGLDQRIINKVHAELDREERRPLRTTIGMFMNSDAYQYPRLLREYLDQYAVEQVKRHTFQHRKKTLK